MCTCVCMRVCMRVFMRVCMRVCVRVCMAVPQLCARMLWMRAASVWAARRARAERHEASVEGGALMADLG